LPYAVDHFNRIRAGLALNSQHNRTISIEPACSLVVLNTVGDLSDVAEPHRRAVTVGHDHRSETRGVLALPVRKNGERVTLAVKSSGRCVGISGLQRVVNFV